MEQAPENKYLQAKVLTASPEQLQLMLYDGCIRFCEQARTAMQEKQIENSYKLLSRAEAIILELCNSMREEIAPEPCANMRRLYLFCYERLVTANMKKDLPALDEALSILRDLRQTWILLLEELKTQNNDSLDSEPEPAPAQAAASADTFQQPVGATINFQG